MLKMRERRNAPIAALIGDDALHSKRPGDQDGRE